ncbi:heterotrimeric GTP-binding alpha subunit [Coprinellus micaceus]|uniref:Heterotrimeric GTP-binding alpha subunit n=1 Tax=Coprinellus micaceus TaxID=71717 RepID=A0A4Y7SB20_COPMI|nr:heterotrimeric GTP-binding alpha subunit [Coprinellus micaceus]TEB25770.1 heterotrimeric GTP-binding alpha subunit [Coprinellus micaceus]
MKSKDKSSQKDDLSANPFLSKQWNGGVRPNETEEEAQLRARQLQEAHKISKQIDSNLHEARKAMEKRRKGVKILLLGQSESGKRAFSPKAFEGERQLWKTIIQLNIISSLRIIVETLAQDWESNGAYPRTPTDSPADGPARKLRRLRLTLSPLFFIGSNVLKLISPDCKDNCREVCVRGTEWKGLLKRRPRASSVSDAPEYSLASRRRSQSVVNQEIDPTSVLCGSRAEIIDLWADPLVRQTLQRHRVYLEQMPGFFLNDIARIATMDYLPSDSDIVRARIRTVGVEEHHFVFEKGAESNADVYITDVGGSRSQRATWVPYFDDVQAILFLAPLAFNQTLEEAVRVNRLEDSMMLWREICSSKLLAKANLILFFNKMDVLQATLAAGVEVRRYVPTYGDLPNDEQTVTKYFKEKFRTYHRRNSPQPRPFMCYETSAIDINSMAVLLIGVRESILRQHLREGDML